MTINRLGRCVVCNAKTRGSQLCQDHGPDLNRIDACKGCPFRRECTTRVMGGNPVMCERVDNEDNNRRMYYDAFGSPDWVMRLAAAMVVGMQSGHFDLGKPNSDPYYKYRGTYHALLSGGHPDELDRNARVHRPTDGAGPSGG